jgi:8-oxo-dGTP diphosphatase
MKRSGASIIFINSRREVLLLLRDDKPEIPYPNMWDLPGGHVEQDETPEACIVREMLEEIETDVSDCRLHAVYDFPDRIEHIFLMSFDVKADSITLHEGQRLAGEGRGREGDGRQGRGQRRTAEGGEHRAVPRGAG